MKTKLLAFFWFLAFLRPATLTCWTKDSFSKLQNGPQAPYLGWLTTDTYLIYIL